MLNTPFLNITVSEHDTEASQPTLSASCSTSSSSTTTPTTTSPSSIYRRCLWISGASLLLASSGALCLYLNSAFNHSSTSNINNNSNAIKANSASISVLPPLSSSSSSSSSFNSSSETPLPSIPDITVVGIDAVKTWADSLRTQGEQQFSSAGLTRFASPNLWAHEIVYSIQVDRFNDGDPSINGLNLPQYQQQHSAENDQSGISDYRHGGDLQGIVDRLDYLVDLGITSLWITPVLHHDGSYHGYCTTDPTDIDPGFGSRETFRSFVQEAHKRGIRVVMDIVINHLCDQGTRYQQQPNHASCPNDLGNLYWAGTPGGAGSQGSLSFSSSFFGPFKDAYFFNRCGANSGAETGSESNAAIFGDFVPGMFDYDTRNWDWQYLFTAIHMYWMAYADIDGFRLDAAKHVTDDFLAYFSSTVRSYARSSLNKSNFLVVGEVAASAGWIAERVGNMESDPTDPTKHGTVPIALTNRLETIKQVYQADGLNRYPGMNAAYVFEESGTSVSWLQQSRPVGDVAAFFTSSDFATISGQADIRNFWSNLEIHDWSRFLVQASEPGGSLHPQAAYPAAAYLLTAFGTPLIYYGFEQGFSGVCASGTVKIDIPSSSTVSEVESVCSGGSSDALKRQDMFVSGPWKLTSIAPKTLYISGIGYATMQPRPESWKSDPFCDTTADLYTFVRSLTHVRRSCRALSEGATYFRYADPLGKIGIFSRVVSGLEVIVVVNNYGATIPLPASLVIDATINGGVIGQKYVNLFNGQEYGIVSHSTDGGLVLTMKQGLAVVDYGSMIFVLESNVNWGQYNTYKVGLCNN